MRGIKIPGVMAILIACVLTGCAGTPLTQREQMTYGGGALGAATGALIGAVSGSAAVGAAIGGPVGAIGGYLIGNSIQSGGGGSYSQSPSAVSGSSGYQGYQGYQVRGYSRKVSPQASKSKTSKSKATSGSGAQKGSGTDSADSSGQVF